MPVIRSGWRTDMRAFIRKNWKKSLICLVCVLCVLLSAVCYIRASALSDGLDSQKAAQRWQGESEMSFAQISCFMPTDNRIDTEAIYNFRLAFIKAMEDASLNVNDGERLWLDAWSTQGKLHASGSLGDGDLSVTAVGGDFFSFHPLRLVSGSYIRPDDLMQDRAVLDEESAWLLFGGTDVQGLSFNIGEKSFTVAGVIKREQDSISKKAYHSGMGIFMSFDAYKELNENAGADCYEFIMAEPVKGFARSTAETSFPVKNCEIIDNTNRFEAIRTLKMALSPYARAMQTGGVLYPYWENAARYTEGLCGAYLLWTLIFALFPAGVIIYNIAVLICRGKRKLDNDVIPKAKGDISERVRVVQRKRWEKYHGKHLN